MWIKIKKKLSKNALKHWRKTEVPWKNSANSPCAITIQIRGTNNNNTNQAKSNSLLLTLDPGGGVWQEEEVHLVLGLWGRLLHYDVQHPRRHHLIEQHTLRVAARVATQQPVQCAALDLTGRETYDYQREKDWWTSTGGKETGRSIRLSHLLAIASEERNFTHIKIQGITNLTQFCKTQIGKNMTTNADTHTHLMMTGVCGGMEKYSLPDLGAKPFWFATVPPSAPSPPSLSSYMYVRGQCSNRAFSSSSP